ncbi:MAG: hypothetical protein QM669_09675 [Siphonobacter sp.]
MRIRYILFLAIVAVLSVLLSVKSNAQIDSALTTTNKPLIQKSGRKTIIDELGEKKNKIKDALSNKENFKKAALSTLSASANTPAGEFSSDNLPNDLGLKIKSSYKKKKQKKVNNFLRNEYENIPITKIVNRLGSGDNITVEEFFVLKDYKQPSLFVRDIYWYDYKASRIIATPIKDKAYAQILHGPYRRFKGDHLEEEGFYFIGTKDGRWEKYGRDIDGDEGLIDKQLYIQGFPNESIISYYDTDKKKIKEVIPKMHGHYTGLYRSFYEGGQLKEEGMLDDSIHVRMWREYFQFGSGGRTKRDMQYGKDKYDVVEPLLLREYDNKGKLIFENKKGRKEETVEEDRF